MDRIKTLIEIGPAIDQKKTGVGYFVQNLTESLELHHQNDLQITGYYFNFLGRNQNNIPPFLKDKVHQITVMPGKLLSVCRRLGFQPFLEVFTRKDADIIVFTNYVSLPLVKKKKTALIIYDLGFLDHPEYMQEVNLRYLQTFCPSSIRRADLIITISEFTKQRLVELFPGITADIVVTPIPPPMAALPSKNTDLSDNLVSKGIVKDNYILYLGTIEPRKNIQSLLQAYRLLPESLKDTFSLVLAGGKGWKDEEILAGIEQCRNEGLKVIATGYITDDEKEALYAHASCFVLPSHYEGFGMPILEAMQHSIPVCVSDIPVFHEVAENAVLYFDKDNPDDIAKTLTQILTDSALRDQLIRDSEAQLSRLSWKDNSDKVYTAIKHCLLEK